jgi:hypothetical protein
MIMANGPKRYSALHWGAGPDVPPL